LLSNASVGAKAIVQHAIAIIIIFLRVISCL